MALTVQLFTAESTVEAHPTVTVTVPAGYKILGGGAFDHWVGRGNLLTASYPQTSQTWYVAGKDHEDPSPAAITAYALALYDPTDEWDVVTQQRTSLRLPHPQAEANLPAGYVLTGGGAWVDYHGQGNLLTASFPVGDSNWQARSKDHDLGDPAQITAYAIGIRHRRLLHRVQHNIASATGASAQHPTAQVALAAGYTMSGGGAIDNWDGAGNLLTASYPQGSNWVAAGKDHKKASPSTITAYVIGIQRL
jgi:vibriolysin